MNVDEVSLCNFDCRIRDSMKNPHIPYSLLNLFVCFPDDNCRLADYRRLKTKILDMHDKRYTGSSTHGTHKDNMSVRRQLVDLMFRRFDADDNGQISAGELSQVRTKPHVQSFQHSAIFHVLGHRYL